MPRKNRPTANLELLLPSDGQLRLIDKSYEQQVQEGAEVECLGWTFASDEARRAFIVELLRSAPYVVGVYLPVCIYAATPT